MKVSVIITTYNWPEALNITLESLQLQTVFPDEIIIADDGSKQPTIDLIEEWKSKSKVPIIHSWQEDEGFQLAKSRNKAISKCNFEYIILIDGDLYLHKDFIKGHKKNAKENQFCVGTRVILSNHVSTSIFQNISNAKKINLFTLNIKNRKNSISSYILASLFSFTTNSIHKVRGANMSFWKKDLLKVNGFNEDFVGWGREDTEIVVRLLNKDIKRKNIKFCANVLHLYHEENSRNMLPENDKILKSAINSNTKWCENGVDKYL